MLATLRKIGRALERAADRLVVLLVLAFLLYVFAAVVPVVWREVAAFFAVGLGAIALGHVADELTGAFGARRDRRYRHSTCGWRMERGRLRWFEEEGPAESAPDARWWT